MSYVYWRAPDGKAHKGSDGKYAPTTLIRELSQRAKVGDDGSVSYADFFPTTYMLAIASTAAVMQPNGEELGEADTEQILHRAINNAIRDSKGKAISHIDVLREANKLAKEHYQLPLQKFVLVSSLSLDAFPAKYIWVNGCIVRPVNRRSSKFVYPKSFRLIDIVPAFRDHANNTRYQLIRITTQGRCIHEAVDKALDAIDLLRGIWTLFATYRQSSIHWGVRRQIPLGVIHLGPIHLLRHPDGKLSDNGFWYEPSYVEDQKLFSPSKGWDRIEKDRKWALKRLKIVEYGKELERLIIRYVRALDHTNLDVAFLNMWSILEKLTGTIGKDYDATIERTIRPFKDRKACAEQLHALRLRRNRFVHSVSASENRDAIVYLIKSFVEPLLAALLRNDFQIRSLSEFVEYLSLPVDLDTLQRRRRQYQRILEMTKTR